MRTVVLGPPPAELERIIAQRRALGLDTHDEVWEGDYHMAPAAHGRHGWLDQELAEYLGPLAQRAGLRATGPINLGGPDDFRVPDRALLADPVPSGWYDTAAVVVEIESPDDETWEKPPFYAAHRVSEVVVVTAENGTVTWLALQDGSYTRVDRSRLIDSGSSQLATAIEWPPAGDQQSS